MFCLISHFSRSLSTTLENPEYPQPARQSSTHWDRSTTSSCCWCPAMFSLAPLAPQLSRATLSGRGLFGTIFGIFKATSIISPFKTPSLAPFLPKECGQHRLCRQLKKQFVMLCHRQNIVKSERVGSHFQPLTEWTCDLGRCWRLTALVNKYLLDHSFQFIPESLSV